MLLRARSIRVGWRSAAGLEPSANGDALTVAEPITSVLVGKRIAATVVLVHGNFLGPWSWNDVTDVLASAQVPAKTIRLPSSITDGNGPRGDLYADATQVRAVLNSLRGPVVLCGHSYGGAVITQAAAGPHPAVRRLVYLTAAVPDVGESLTDLAGAAEESDGAAQAAREAVHVRPDGMIELDPDSARTSLFHDCSPRRAEQAIAQLEPANPAVGTQPLQAAAWRMIPVTHIRGTADRMPQLVSPAFPFESIELIELPTGHCPNWSRPDLVGEVLIDQAT
jgi:pimeloyl-ACP methyl ester carboxylesterase